MARRRVLILGAAGRDFHTFNTAYRDEPDWEVVAFTATQIPRISGRCYPSELAGPLYDEDIPIYQEADLERLIRDLDIHEVVFAYSDVSYDYVGHLASRAVAAGANFVFLGCAETMLPSDVPVVAITATRTGCGKSQTTRYVGNALQSAGLKVVAIRHPMPYGDLAKQAVQRFAEYDDLDRHECTFEEREEYEVHIDHGIVVYAGVDYAAILEQAQTEADVIIWDGGNNDWPFYRPDLWINLADPLRPGHGAAYYPGEVNFRAADIIVINKVNTASAPGIQEVVDNVAHLNPKAAVIKTESVVSVSDPEAVAGKRVLCIEDGPTLPHGEMSFGAGLVAAEKFEAAEVVDPRPNAVGSIRRTLDRFPHIGKLLPAMGYFPEQIADLETSINATDCDLVLVGTPFDLGRALNVDKPTLRVTYESREVPGHGPSLADRVVRAVKR